MEKNWIVIWLKFDMNSAKMKRGKAKMREKFGKILRKI